MKLSEAITRSKTMTVLYGEQPPILGMLALVGINPTSTTIFAFGDKIYSPSKKKVMRDFIVHEAVHSIQQQVFQSPTSWWDRYIKDTQYRYECEIEAYGIQLQYIKLESPTWMPRAKHFAYILSGKLYNVNKSQYQVLQDLISRI